MIINEEMIKKAIDLIKPTAEKILENPDFIWGPGWVAVCIIIPGYEDDVFKFEYGNAQNWQPEWKKTRQEFEQIAESKVLVASRARCNTSIVVAATPWLLRDREYLYPGGVFHNGISVGVSGAKGTTDELIAELVANSIATIAKLETESRIAKKESKI